MKLRFAGTVRVNLYATALPVVMDFPGSGKPGNVGPASAVDI